MTYLAYGRCNGVLRIRWVQDAVGIFGQHWFGGHGGVSFWGAAARQCDGRHGLRQPQDFLWLELLQFMGLRLGDEEEKKRF